MSNTGLATAPAWARADNAQKNLEINPSGSQNIAGSSTTAAFNPNPYNFIPGGETGPGSMPVKPVSTGWGPIARVAAESAGVKEPLPSMSRETPAYTPTPENTKIQSPAIGGLQSLDFAGARKMQDARAQISSAPEQPIPAGFEALFPVVMETTGLLRDNLENTIEAAEERISEIRTAESADAWINSPESKPYRSPDVFVAAGDNIEKILDSKAVNSTFEAAKTVSKAMKDVGITNFVEVAVVDTLTEAAQGITNSIVEGFTQAFGGKTEEERKKAEKPKAKPAVAPIPFSIVFNEGASQNQANTHQRKEKDKARLKLAGKEAKWMKWLRGEKASVSVAKIDGSINQLIDISNGETQELIDMKKAQSKANSKTPHGKATARMGLTFKQSVDGNLVNESNATAFSNYG